MVAAALVRGRREGFAPLRAALPLWIAAAAFLGWIGVELVRAASIDASYDTGRWTVSAAKFAEYAVLAPALTLLLRSRRDARPLLLVLAGWTALAAAVGVAQFFGAPIFMKGTFGHRQASFLGSSDLAALSGAALAAGAVFLLAHTPPRRAAWVATLAGLVGVVVAGAISSAVGLALAVGGALVVLTRRGDVPRRRAFALGAAALVAIAGAAAVRQGDIADYFAFSSGVRESTVHSYSQRTVLLYLGWRIFEEEPAFGVGWLRSRDPDVFERYLPDARARYPGLAETAFPGPGRDYGIQNLYVQALADLGVVGLALLAGLFAAAIVLAARAAVASVLGIVALVWLLLLLGLWLAQGFVSGVPLDALHWYAFGLAGAAAASRPRAVRGVDTVDA